MKIAILMTCFNRKATTLKCLEALVRAIAALSSKAGAETCSFDLWLNDDGCTDGTSDAVRDWYNSNTLNSNTQALLTLSIVKGSGHDYWCGGMRRAWQAAIGSGVDYDGYIWLNDDTLLFEDSISTMLAVDAPIVVGATRNDRGDITYGGRDERGKLIMPGGDSVPVISFNGNCVLVRESAYDKLGVFPGYLTHALGDFDYGLRAKENGAAAFMAGKFIGICDNVKPKTIWMDEHVPLLRRWRNLHSPKGGPEPSIFFRFNRVHYGLLFAIRIFVQQYLHLLFPIIWRLKK